MELDRISLQLLQPNQVVLWLNNKAYNLSKLGQPDEALEHLQDAQELFIGDDGLAKDAALAACIHSTRGLALLQKGDLDRAEKSLELALRLESDSMVTQFDQLNPDGDPSRTAERYFLLGEISKRRGNESEAKLRFQQAAAFALTEYGYKAAQILNPSISRTKINIPKETFLSLPNVKKVID